MEQVNTGKTSTDNQNINIEIVLIAVAGASHVGLPGRREVRLNGHNDANSRIALYLCLSRIVGTNVGESRVIDRKRNTQAQ